MYWVVPHLPCLVRTHDSRILLLARAIFLQMQRTQTYHCAAISDGAICAQVGRSFLDMADGAALPGRKRAACAEVGPRSGRPGRVSFAIVRMCCLQSHILAHLFSTALTLAWLIATQMACGCARLASSATLRRDDEYLVSWRTCTAVTTPKYKFNA